MLGQAQPTFGAVLQVLSSVPVASVTTEERDETGVVPSILVLQRARKVGGLQ